MTNIEHDIFIKIYNLFITFRLYSMCMKKHIVKKDDGIFYYEGGSSSTKGAVILIHGFADSKNGHLMVAKQLLSQYRVLIPDLPGFGENIKFHQEKYSLTYMSEKVIELLKEKKLEKVHILGNSLGGAVAMGIAAKAPELVKSLVLVGSAGFYNCNIRTVQNEILEGDYIFDVKSDYEFRKLVGRIFTKPPKIPSFIFNIVSKEFQAQGKWYRKLLDDLTATTAVNSTCAADDVNSVNEKNTFSNANSISDKLLKDSYNSRAREFTMNTLLIWGEKDKIIPPETGAFAKSIIPNSKLVILKNAGHAPQHENLPDYMDALLIFLNENESNNSLIGEI